MLALRKQLEASEISLKAEQNAKAGAERRAEQAPRPTWFPGYHP